MSIQLLSHAGGALCAGRQAPTLAGCGLQGIMRGRNMTVLGGGEEVWIPSGSSYQVLREQG